MEGPRSPRSVRTCFSPTRCELASHWLSVASSHTRPFRCGSFLLETSVLPLGVTVLHFRDCPGVVLVGTTSPGFISGAFRHRCSLSRDSGQRSLPAVPQRGRPAVCQLPLPPAQRLLSLSTCFTRLVPIYTRGTAGGPDARAFIPPGWRTAWLLRTRGSRSTCAVSRAQGLLSVSPRPSRKPALLSAGLRLSLRLRPPGAGWCCSL